tara:strand:- start:2302 stop:2835 length:534 start_codon:yes stop_codon:yes gene_type:complete
MVTQLIYKVIFKKNKKGVSGIIATVIMIGLVIAIAAILWSVVNNLIGEQVSSSESCFGNFGKVTLNKQYVCKDSIANEIQFAINIGDIDVDSALVSVSGQSGTKSFEIKNSTTYSYVKMFGGSYGGALQLPGENAGLTYVVGLTTLGITDATSIKIAPVLNGNQCEVSDSITSIGSC